jgi:hypothetical protein
MACGRRFLRIIILRRTLFGTTAKLVSEGQQTPLTVYDSGHTDEKGRKVYILIGGFRRSQATIAIEMWPARGQPGYDSPCPDDDFLRLFDEQGRPSARVSFPQPVALRAQAQVPKKASPENVPSR